MDDMNRFRERVLDLKRHFGQANDDIDKILTSSEKIAARGGKIETLEFEEAVPAQVEQRNGASPSPPSLSPKGRGRGAAARGEAAEWRVPPAGPARQKVMSQPLPLWHGIVLDQMLVGAAASLVNLIIHAVLLALVVWTVRGIAVRDQLRSLLHALHAHDRADRNAADGGPFRRGDGLGNHLWVGRHSTGKHPAHLPRFR